MTFAFAITTFKKCTEKDGILDSVKMHQCITVKVYLPCLKRRIEKTNKNATIVFSCVCLGPMDAAWLGIEELL